MVSIPAFGLYIDREGGYRAERVATAHNWGLENYSILMRPGNGIKKKIYQQWYSRGGGKQLVYVTVKEVKQNDTSSKNTTFFYLLCGHYTNYQHNF